MANSTVQRPRLTDQSVKRKSTRLALGKPVLVAIAGGSGSGKTWLADRLEQALTPRLVRISLDNFYKDRSHLTPGRRARLNFDHPRAIDWPRVEEVLNCLLAHRSARSPIYDFKTHSRLRRALELKPKPIVLLEGLWPLKRRAIHRLVTLSVFLHCPAHLRLRRRLVRDQAARGRTRASIERQFRDAVEPMHLRFVVPQSNQADFVLRKSFGRPEVRILAKRIKELVSKPRPMIAERRR